MKTSVLITLDPEAKENLKKRAKANGMTLSGYINVLGHASEIYHRLKSKEEKNMKRSSTTRAKDARIFRDTATKMKTMNLPKKMLRGGIRL